VGPTAGLDAVEKRLHAVTFRQMSETTVCLLEGDLTTQLHTYNESENIWKEAVVAYLHPGCCVEGSKRRKASGLPLS
jgi:hypothetical protein